MEQAFRGFTALPERASRNWREVLGVTLATPTLQHIEDRFKNLAQVHHPDKGGDRNRFEEIVQAREAARLELAVMIFRRSRPREPRDHTHGFKDPRSRVLWRSGRTILKGEDKTDLRRRVFQRAGGRCEDERHGKRCNRFASWQGIGHGELSHREHGPHRGTLRLKNAKVFVDDEVSQP
jgi:curved DNA-binding protein CbpA